jgi:hypothetical protein
MAEQEITLRCLEDAADCLHLRAYSLEQDGDTIAVTLNRPTVIVTKPADLIIAALTLTSDEEMPALVKRLNSILHPGPNGN